jgi:hypothetical protein
MTDFGQFLVLGTKNAAGFSNYGVFLSTDSGNSWLFDGLDIPITDVAANSTEYFAIASNTIYSTQNMGNSWDETMIGNPNYPFTNIERLNNIVTVQTSNNGVYYLNNGNWVQLGNGGIGGTNRVLNKTICQKQNGGIFIGSSTYKYANNGNITYINNGVSKYNGGNLDVSENLISKYSVYPNPVTNSFTINGLENNENITSILLKDMHGKIVKELALDNMTFDIQALKTGVYLVEIYTNDSTEIIRIVKQ